MFVILLSVEKEEVVVDRSRKQALPGDSFTASAIEKVSTTTDKKLQKNKSRETEETLIPVREQGRRKRFGNNKKDAKFKKQKILAQNRRVYFENSDKNNEDDGGDYDNYCQDHSGSSQDGDNDDDYVAVDEDEREDEEDVESIPKSTTHGDGRAKQHAIAAIATTTTTKKLRRANT